MFLRLGPENVTNHVTDVRKLSYNFLTTPSQHDKLCNRGLQKILTIFQFLKILLLFVANLIPREQIMYTITSPFTIECTTSQETEPLSEAFYGLFTPIIRTIIAQHIFVWLVEIIVI